MMVIKVTFSCITTNHGPRCFAFAYIQDEPPDDFFSLWGMRDLWMELNAKEWFAFMGYGGKRGSSCASNYLETLGCFGDLVTM